MASFLKISRFACSIDEVVCLKSSDVNKHFLAFKISRESDLNKLNKIIGDIDSILKSYSLSKFHNVKILLFAFFQI